MKDAQEKGIHQYEETNELMSNITDVNSFLKKNGKSCWGDSIVNRAHVANPSSISDIHRVP